MTLIDSLGEFAALLLSSAGLSGSVFAVIFSFLLKRAKSDAETKREERMQLEIQRLDGEEKLSSLLFALLRYSRGMCGDSELEEAEKAYAEYIEAGRKLKNRIIGTYTSK